MFASSTFMEKGKCRDYVYFLIEYELASLTVLVFVLHEDPWEYGSNWCIGLQKDEELWTYEGW
jgi:hypothetical protein